MVVLVWRILVLYHLCCQWDFYESNKFAIFSAAVDLALLLYSELLDPIPRRVQRILYPTLRLMASVVLGWVFEACTCPPQHRFPVVRHPAKNRNEKNFLIFSLACSQRVRITWPIMFGERNTSSFQFWWKSVWVWVETHIARHQLTIVLSACS